MKGLIYRDVIINKKTIILALFFLVYLFNLILNDDMTIANDMLLMINLYTFINIVLVYAMAEFILKPDRVSKWEIFLYSTPITKRTLVGEKYIFDYIFVGIGTISSLALIVTFNINLNREITYDECLGIVFAIFIILLNSAIHKPLAYAFSERGAGIFSSIFVLLLLALGTISILTEKMKWIDNIGKKMDFLIVFSKSKKMLGVLVIIILFHYFSFLVSTKIYNKKFE